MGELFIGMVEANLEIILLMDVYSQITLLMDILLIRI